MDLRSDGATPSARRVHGRGHVHRRSPARRAQAAAGLRIDLPRRTGAGHRVRLVRSEVRERRRPDRHDVPAELEHVERAPLAGRHLDVHAGAGSRLAPGNVLRAVQERAPTGWRRMSTLIPPRVGQFLSHPRRSWRTRGMERPYLWMKLSPVLIAVCAALLACKNPLASTDREDGAAAPPAPTPMRTSSSTEVGTDSGIGTQQGDTLGPASEWVFRVTGVVLKRVPLQSVEAYTSSFPEDRSEKLCIEVRRTGDSCCINYGGSGCSVPIQAGDLVRSGMGLSVVFHREGKVILTLNGVRFAANSVRYASKGYALPLKRRRDGSRRRTCTVGQPRVAIEPQRVSRAKARMTGGAP